MKRLPPRSCRAGPGRRAAFTLVEMMVTLGIFSMLIVATVSTLILGLRMYCEVDAKLTENLDARRLLDTIRTEIWAGKLLFIGNGDALSFTLLSDNTPHIGNALRICPTTDTNSYVYYFLDPTDTCFKRMASSSTNVTVIASNIVSPSVFQAEDCQGNILTNYKNNRLIGLRLQVAQTPGAGIPSQSCPIQAHFARRAIE